MSDLVYADCPRFDLDGKLVLTKNTLGAWVVEPRRQRRGTYQATSLNAFLYGRFLDFPEAARAAARRIVNTEGRS
jgi:hypothetical protein